MSVLYNEWDKELCGWLSDLMDDGLITPGTIDDRSIEDLTPDYVSGFTRVHLFAGIGGWDRALQLAGWPLDRPVWSCSCPCQPFSEVGKGAGFADERHLWPAAHHLIRVCKPDVVFGEQVESKDALTWVDLVRTDLEGEDYALGISDTPAAGYGAPHIRQRLYWVGDTFREGLERHSRHVSYAEGWEKPDRSATQTNEPCGGFWREADWFDYRDGKRRPSEPGTRIMAYGFPQRVVALLGAGNAIVAPQAAEWIKSYMEVAA